MKKINKLMKCRKSKIFEHVRKRRFLTKAQGLPLNVIVVAIICLVVLVILIYIFKGQIGSIAHSFIGMTPNETAVKGASDFSKLGG